MFALFRRAPLYTYGFKAYSQSDEDGILAEIFRRIGTTNRVFVEIGLGTGNECNTRYFLEHGWRGQWIEGFPDYAGAIRHEQAERLSSGQLVFTPAYVTASTVNDLIRDAGITGEIDLFSLDIDSNDYHVFEALNVIRPRVVVLEHNHTFPPPQRYVMPRDDNYVWPNDGTPESTKYGASIQSMAELAKAKGYTLVGCGRYSPNGFYVRDDLVRWKFAGPFDPARMFNPLDYEKVVAYPVTHR